MRVHTGRFTNREHTPHSGVSDNFYVSLKDLSSIEGRDLASGTEAEVITRLREVYDFLPKETRISLKDGIVRIDIPEQVIANKLEATRLQEKASQRAK
jgi:hypothetical protein